MHCLGMCGPIAFALPLDRSSRFTEFLGAFSYNLGRIVTYAILGVLFGAIGKSLVMAGAQRTLSIAAGVFMLLSVFAPILFKRLTLNNISYRYITKLQGWFATLFRRSSPESLFTIGILNGLLPCAMVYLGLAGAVAEGSALEGSLFMIVFGLGTLPMMYGASTIGTLLSSERRAKLQRFLPVLITILGILFILRGMNLGIHYVSPEIKRVNPEMTDCE
mgnify:CR=1 FL=1